MSPSRLLTATEVADLLSVPKTWVYEQARAGLLPTVCLGRYKRFRAEAIADWVQEQETGRGASTTRGGR